MLTFASALITALLVSAGLRDRRMLICSLALLLNWAALTALVTVTGQQFDWRLNGTVDYVTAVMLIATCPRGRLRGVVVLTYAALLLAHAGYALSPQDGWAQYYYWQAMSKIAWVQVIIVLLAGGGRFVRRAGFLRGTHLRERLGAVLTGLRARPDEHSRDAVQPTDRAGGNGHSTGK